MKLKQIAILSLPLIGMCLTSCSGAGVHHEASEYFVETPYSTNFKILQLTDIHVTMTDDLDLHFKFMDLTIKDANPDLIVITGDMFTFATYTVVERLFKFLDSYNVPWAVTFGNHDEQIYFSATQLSQDLNTKYKNCLFKDIINDDVFGNANYCINLTKDNKTEYQLYVFDSNRYRYDKMGYDNFHQDQVDWYERMVNYSTKQNGGEVIPSLGFFHIPFEQFQIAYDLYQKGSEEVILHYGQNNEKVCCSEVESGMFNKMKELGSTKGVFVGHDHVNNSDLEYQGIRLVYGIKATDRVSYVDSMMGGQVIILQDDGTFKINRIYHKYSEVK